MLNLVDRRESFVPSTPSQDSRAPQFTVPVGPDVRKWVRYRPASTNPKYVVLVETGVVGDTQKGAASQWVSFCLDYHRQVAEAQVKRASVSTMRRYPLWLNLSSLLSLVLLVVSVLVSFSDVTAAAGLAVLGFVGVKICSIASQRTERKQGA